MSKLFGRSHSASQGEGGSGEVEPSVRDASAVDPRSSKTRKSGRARPAAADAEGGGASVDFAQVGEQVAMVLEAAKAAAEEMRLEADTEARRIRAATEKEARDALQSAKVTAERAETAAATIRADAEHQSKEVREQADAYANDTREAADVKAAAVLSRAEKQASERESTFQERRRSLDEGVGRTEERLRQLVAGLHELAAGLEDLIAPESHESNGNGDNGAVLEILTLAAGESHAPTREGRAS